MLHEFRDMKPEEHPLVELAVRLGYTVTLVKQEVAPGEIMTLYRVDNGMGRSNEGDRLVDALAFTIKRDVMSVTTPVV